MNIITDVKITRFFFCVLIAAMCKHSSEIVTNQVMQNICRKEKRLDQAKEIQFIILRY